MKNILICLERMDIGGVETSVLNQVMEYKRRGIKPIVISKTGIFTDILKENNIDYEEIEFPLENNIDINRINKIIEIIDKYNVEQVVINQLPCILSVLPACIIKNIPYVAYVHTSFQSIKQDENNIYNWYERTYPFFKDLLKIYFENASKIVAISSLAANYVKERYNIKEDKFLVLKNSINLNEYKSSNNENRKEKWVLISRLSNEKLQSVKNGIDLFDIYNNPNKILTIVGDGDKREELEEYAKTKTSKDKIKFIGAKNNVKEIIDENDIVLGLDRVMLEALAMKKIAVLIGYDSLKQVISMKNIEIEANEGFCGESLESTSTKELAKFIEDENINVEDNYEFIKENLNIEKNIYLEEPIKPNYTKTILKIFELIQKLQEDKLELEKEILNLKNIDNNELEKLKQDLDKKEQEIKSVNEEKEKIFNELQSLYNSKRFKIVNNIAKILKK